MAISDIPAGSWYKDEVTLLLNRRIISGYSSGEFRPVNYMTRAEFAKVMCLAMGWDLLNQDRPSFSDVPRGRWDYVYIETAKQKGAISGYPNGEFRPNNTISRAEIAAIIAKSLGATGTDEALSDIQNSWAREFIAACVKAGIITGYQDRSFRPNNKATRAEVSKMMARAIKVLDEK